MNGKIDCLATSLSLLLSLFLACVLTCTHTRFENGRGGWKEREREREREREGARETVSGWRYIVGLAARGKLGGQSFDRLFGKHRDRVRVQTWYGYRPIPYLPFANALLMTLVTMENNSWQSVIGILGEIGTSWSPVWKFFQGNCEEEWRRWGLVIFKRAVRSIFQSENIRIISDESIWSIRGIFYQRLDAPFDPEHENKQAWLHLLMDDRAVISEGNLESFTVLVGEADSSATNLTFAAAK